MVPIRGGPAQGWTGRGRDITFLKQMRVGIRRPPTGHGMNMDPLLRTIAEILYVALDLYVWVLIISAILSWLIAFNVVNTRNRVVYIVGDFLYRVTEPALRPIRRVLPNLGGLDISPVLLILLLLFLQNLLLRDIAPALLRGA